MGKTAGFHPSVAKGGMMVFWTEGSEGGTNQTKDEKWLLIIPSVDRIDTCHASFRPRSIDAITRALASLSLLDVSVSLSVCLISVCLFSAPRYYQECCLSPRSMNECTRSFASSSERDAEILTTDERASTYVKCCCATC